MEILASIKRTHGYWGGGKPGEASADFEMFNKYISIGAEGAWMVAWVFYTQPQVYVNEAICSFCQR